MGERESEREKFIKTREEEKEERIKLEREKVIQRNRK